jgi:L-ascorbate metabolism protein UlaG (beta-lactamase superfamily)
MADVQTLFLGTSTVLITDGESSVLVDGFFSRPSLRRLLTGVRPDEEAISWALRRAAIDRLDVVAVSHSHVDHALDAPVVADKTGARLAGSPSTRMIASGYGVGVERFLPLEAGVPVAVGAFTLTAVAALHSPADRYPGTIDAPVTLPAKTAQFRTGECYSFHLAHPDGTVLVHPTANFIPGALADYPCDVLYLAAAGASGQSNAWRDRYWTETVVATGAQTVIPVHFDRFWRGLDKPLLPLPKSIDDLQLTLAGFTARAHGEKIDFHMPELWQREAVRRG